MHNGCMNQVNTYVSSEVEPKGEATAVKAAPKAANRKDELDRYYRTERVSYRL
jgi:hypothetical protein